jgi:cyclopropane fatty-acyl-phospholipid synthase-like methyltransferase
VTPDLQARIDAAVEQNIAPDEYFSVWEELGAWQLDSLKSLGLAPRHRLLDVGCGALRFGLSAIEYLNDGNYYGVDAFAPYVAAGRRLAEIAGIAKHYTLLVSRDFEFERFGIEFDFGNAQSVFTHLSGDECDRCMLALRRAMKPGSVFFFTYLIGAPATQGMLYVGAQPMRRFAMTDPDFFAKLAERHSARFEPLPIVHPTGQQVAAFRF